MVAMANRSVFFNVYFRCLFVFAIFIACFPHNSDGNAELENSSRCGLMGKFEKKCTLSDGNAEHENTLRCALMGKFEEKCTLSGPGLKPHFIDLLSRSSDQFINILRGRKVDLQPKLVTKIPLSLVYLLPAEVWSRVKPIAAAEMVKSHRKSKAVALSVTSGYASLPFLDKANFLINFDFGGFERSVVSVVATEVTSKWTMNVGELLGATAAPFFLALPEGYVLKMEKRHHFVMLNHIIESSYYFFNRGAWADLPAITKRVWAIISRTYTWEGRGMRSATAFVSGATPSELQQRGKLFDQYDLTQLPLKSRLQIRALMPIVRTEQEFNIYDLNLLRNWFHLLRPGHITRFNDRVEFMYLVKQEHFKWWSSSLSPRPFSIPSIPALRQVIEMITLKNNERQSLPLDPTRWEDEIAIFGPLTYLIGARRLGKLEDHHKPLQLQTLREIESPYFSKRMARRLIYQFEDVHKLKGLLRGVPTGRLHSLAESQTHVDGMDNLREIAQNIPVDKVPARLASVFRKIRENLSVFKNLEAILRNPNGEQFFSLLTYEETVTLYKELARYWDRIVSKNLADTIPSLTDSVLENLLSSPKKLKIESSLSDHLETKAVAGLTCERLVALDPGDIPEKIAGMRHARRRAWKSDMSKRLQRCARIVVDRYLIERASSTFAARKAVMYSTVSAINPVDIENFGGFLLSTFPPHEIVKNPHAKMIMKKIGSLSTYELISAVPCYQCLRTMAETAVEINNAKQNITFSNLLDLGSLVGFLPPYLISSIFAPDWRITAEAAALDGSSHPLCADEESRSAWEILIRDAFGPPEQWTADTLAEIGGYMPALLDNTLQSVSLDEVSAAGDTMPLSSGAPYLEPVEFIGYDHPRPFWKVCRDLLERQERRGYETSVRVAARFQLFAAQLYNGEVKSSETLKQLRIKKRPTFKSVHSPEITPDWNKPLATVGPISTAEPIRPTADTPSLATTTIAAPASAMASKSTWSWSWIPKFDVTKSEESTTPKPSEEIKLEISSDLDDYIKSQFGELETTTQGSVIFSTSFSDEETTEPISNDLVETTTNASFDYIQSEQDRLNFHNLTDPIDVSAQVYVDMENEIENKMDNTTNPAAALNLKLKDIPSVPVIVSTSKPAPDTNGTVYLLSDLSKISEDSEIESEDTTPETQTTAGDVTIFVTSNKMSRDIALSATPVMVKVDELSAAVPTSNPYDSTPAPDLKASLNRRRRDIEEQVFKTTLTCDGLLTMGKAAGLALSSADVDMSYEEFEDCVEFLGKLELSKEVARAFWEKLNKKTYWETIEDVGCLVAGMTTEDIDALDLDIYNDHFLDTISAVSMYADKVVVKAMISKLKNQLDAEVKSKGRVHLAEEIVLALGQDVCYLPDDSLSHLVNTPNVLVRSFSGMNRDGFFERTPCQPTCLRNLLKAYLNQNNSAEWAVEDSRNAGVLVAGFSEGDLSRMRSSKTLTPLSGISASAVRCLSENQLKAIDVQSLIWWSPVAAGALVEDQLRVLSWEQRRAIDSAIFGRSGISPDEENEILNRAVSATIDLGALLLSVVVPISYLYFLK